MWEAVSDLYSSLYSSLSYSCNLTQVFPHAVIAMPRQLQVSDIQTRISKHPPGAVGDERRDLPAGGKVHGQEQRRNFRIPSLNVRSLQRL
jgi:hypothetical protein